MAKEAKNQDQDQEKEGLLDFLKGGVASSWELFKLAVGSEKDPTTGKRKIKGHKVVGRSFAGAGVWKIIEGVATLDPIDIILGASGTGFGLILSEKPAWLGMDKKPDGVVEPPTISILELSDEQMDELANRLGLSVHAVYQAHEIAQLSDDDLEKKIRDKYGDLLDRASGKVKGGVSKNEQKILNCIRLFGEAKKREEGEVKVS